MSYKTPQSLSITQLFREHWFLTLQTSILILFILAIFTSCKKQENVIIKLFNPYTQSWVPNARISIIERHQKLIQPVGKVSVDYTFKTVANGVTDANGTVVFTGIKFKQGDTYTYRYNIDEVWGQTTLDFDPGTNSQLSKIKSTNIVICDYTKGTLNLEVKGLFTTGQSGDSLNITPVFYNLFDPEKNKPAEHCYVPAYKFAYDNVPLVRGNFLSQGYPNQACGKFLLRIRKRKLGLLSFDSVLVQIEPLQLKTVSLQW